MTNKNLPDPSADKRTDKANKGATTNTPEMGSTRSVNQGGNASSHPEANDDRRGPARKSDSAVPNHGRDITSGSDGFDGQGRQHDDDVDRSAPNADHKEHGVDRGSTSDDAQRNQRKI
ncbi:MAG: hypothetical protein IPM46_08440 [Flavobacteriales bacterium]|nr:hypothetical protein [Flavobacteriales bacterium]